MMFKPTTSASSSSLRENALSLRGSLIQFIAKVSDDVTIGNGLL